MSARRAFVALLLGVAVTACSTPPNESSTGTPAVAVPPATTQLATMTQQPDPPTPPSEPTGVAVPPAPTEADYFAVDECLDEGCTRIEWTHTVLWRTPPTPGASVLIYGVTECLAKPPKPKNHPDVTGPCLLPGTVLPASALQLLRSAPASDGRVRWVWVEDRPWTCDGWPWEELFSSPDGEDYYAIVIAASNASGQSPYVIADPGEWQGGYMGCGS